MDNQEQNINMNSGPSYSCQQFVNSTNFYEVVTHAQERCTNAAKSLPPEMEELAAKRDVINRPFGNIWAHLTGPIEICLN